MRRVVGVYSQARWDGVVVSSCFDMPAPAAAGSPEANIAVVEDVVGGLVYFARKLPEPTTGDWASALLRRSLDGVGCGKAKGSAQSAQTVCVVRSRVRREEGVDLATRVRRADMIVEEGRRIERLAETMPFAGVEVGSNTMRRVDAMRP